MFFHANLAATCATTSEGVSGQVVTLHSLIREMRQALRARRAVAAAGEDEAAKSAEVLAARCV